MGILSVIPTPPTCSYVAFNNLKGVKEIKHFPINGHDLGTGIWNTMRQRTLAHIAAQSKIPAVSP